MSSTSVSKLSFHSIPYCQVGRSTRQSGQPPKSLKVCQWLFFLTGLPAQLLGNLHCFGTISSGSCNVMQSCGPVSKSGLHYHFGLYCAHLVLSPKYTCASLNYHKLKIRARYNFSMSRPTYSWVSL